VDDDVNTRSMERHFLLAPRIYQIYRILARSAKAPVSWTLGDAEHGILTISFEPPAA